MRKLNTFSIIIIFSLLIYSLSFAQSGRGKLAGKIIDSATNEALIGANVIIVNTNLGAAADINGNYFILNITPGTYEVRVSFVGYQTQTLTDVRVVAGITYELNAVLTSGLNLEEIIVTSEKFFEEKSTNTVKVIDSDDIARLPVKGVASLASLQSGVVIQEGNGGAEGNAEINVRGGRDTEVLYIVDGIPQNDIYTGANIAQVSDAAIEQISFQIGGYEAKYGQAQSGIVNVTTKSGSPKYSFYGDVLTSSFTDDFGYNLYTGTLSGPIIPGEGNHTFFLSGERGWFLDADPSAIGVTFDSYKFIDPEKYPDGFHRTTIPYNQANVWRFSGRTKHLMGDFNFSLGGAVNFRNYRDRANTDSWLYYKHAPKHRPWNEDQNYSFSFKVSQNVSASSFWNINVGYKFIDRERGDGVYFDDVFSYGDSLTAFNTEGVNLLGNGVRVQADDVGLFYDQGRVFNFYRKTNTGTITTDLDFTSQIDNHLLEIGAGFNYNSLRYYSITPVTMSGDRIRALPLREQYEEMRPTYYGYDIEGNESTDGDPSDDSNIDGLKHPIMVYGFVQDRFELDDLVLNIGVRVDYFDSDAHKLVDPTIPYAGGTNPTDFDNGDFKKASEEFYISPRIGLGFPVTESTVFHAQYGKFVQPPTLDMLYDGVEGYRFLQRTDAFRQNNGHVESELTTQYEIGFRQVLGEIGSLNLTAFYKNTEGLINRQRVQYQRVPGGETLEYYTPTNSDFGTVKGLAFSLDIPRLDYFGLSLDYTFSVAEGTGSSTESNYVAAFRNVDGEIPKVIAPLNFDQTHTGLLNLNIYIPQGEFGLFEMINANILASFASGRPYTPLQEQNLAVDFTNWGNTRGYINSTNGPGTFRVDFKLEKSFALGDMIITPYLWIENLFDAKNETDVWQSTGDSYTTEYLASAEGQQLAEAGGEGWDEDYEALELDPSNFGIPRLIKLGFKINFTNIGL
jgi:hypothetical protein